jgi:translation elongation factor EF-1alpha
METRIGEVTHYFAHISVAVLALSGELHIGDLVHIHGHTSDFIQRVRSMEIDHHPIQSIAASNEIALKVYQPVRKGDVVFKITGPEAESWSQEDPTIADTSY